MNSPVAVLLLLAPCRQECDPTQLSCTPLCRIHPVWNPVQSCRGVIRSLVLLYTVTQWGGDGAAIHVLVSQTPAHTPEVYIPHKLRACLRVHSDTLQLLALSLRHLEDDVTVACQSWATLIRVLAARTK